MGQDFGHPDGLAANYKAARLGGIKHLTPEEHRAYLRYHRAKYAAKREMFREINNRSSAKRRDKKRVYDADYYARNKAKLIAKAVAWRKDRRRDFAMKVNQKAVYHGVEGKLDWRDLVPDDCAYCGTPCESWDHVIPMSRGGSNTLDNLVPCCWPCNISKKARTPEEWWAFLKGEAA